MSRNVFIWKTIILAWVVVVTTMYSAQAQTTFLNPGTPYLTTADSPFADHLQLETFFLENFEDGVLNTPGVTSQTGGGVLSPNDQTDSVDGDDGLPTDGSGAAGRSFFSLGNTTIFTFQFSESQLGALPTHAGIVWTDVGIKQSGVDFGFDDVVFEAFDAGGNLLGTTDLADAGDGSTFGQTSEDRFLGVIHDGGISRIELSMSDSSDWEADHLQYGRVPEPATFGILAVGVPLLWFRRRRGLV